jgi:rod shape-determining protein MreC
VSRATKPFRDLAGWVGDNLDAKGQNDKLKKDNAELRKQVTQAQVATRENEQLRKMVGLPQKPGYPSGTDPVAAHVIASSPSVWYSTVQIDKGTGDGVRVDQAVVTGDGLIGRVTAVTGGTATITLITDGDSNVSAEVLPSGARGVLSPDVGNPDDMQLTYVKSKQIKKGDTLVTSGSTSQKLESFFPKGIPIGTVKRVDLSELEGSGKIHIQPFADFRRLEIVQVLRAKPAQSQTEQPPNGVSGPGAGTP